MFRSHAPIAAVVVALLLMSGCQSSSSSEPSAAAARSEAPASASESGQPMAGTLASGSFTANLGSWGQAFVIEATGSGDSVSGSMEVTHPSAGDYSVDLQCSRTADTGLLVIAGEVTQSTHATFAQGAYAAIVLEPGTPVRTILWLDDEASPADSCMAFLDTMFNASDVNSPDHDLIPISGDLELGA